MDLLNINLNNTETNITAVGDDARAAEGRLADYRPKNKDDRTRAVLTKFLQFLPVDGKQMLAEFIAGSPNDEILYSLFHHLLTSILWPGKLDYPRCAYNAHIL